MDRDNNWAPCLGEDWRWIDDRTIEFKLRKGVTFHKGEEFNADMVEVNWEEFRRMESAGVYDFVVVLDETVFEIVDEYTVRLTFSEPDGLV